jgi:hypothetical protein
MPSLEGAGGLLQVTVAAARSYFPNQLNNLGNLSFLTAPDYPTESP